MKKSQWEVFILKPTAAFRAFISAHLPELALPDLQLMQADTTAYLMNKMGDFEATIQEVERHYPAMFRHEILRCLGDDAANIDEIKTSFLDFLCCFKFESHSQIVLMEEKIAEGHQLLCIKPRSVFFKWVDETVKSHNEVTNLLDRVSLPNVLEDATVVIKNFQKPSEVKPFIKHYYRPLFKAEMARMDDIASQWPVVDSFQKFNRYFAVEMHSQLIHMH